MPKAATIEHPCPKCGAIASRSSGDNLCAACLLEIALTDDETYSPDSAILMDFGEYELLEELGRGGQGVVYRARQKRLNRTVALKIIGLGHWATEAHLRRFRVEAEAAAQLDHPAIVPIYEIGDRDGACFFSMKFIDGGQLDELIRQKPLSIREAVALLAKIARTVHYAHENGVLHRDIKPGNILLDRAGEPHLTDFGLARLVEKESNITRTMDVLGTPSYMAPEQAAGKNVTVTRGTDVYGLGAVFYHMLTGQPPFAGGTTYETMKLVCETEPRSPRLWNPKVDGDLATICLKSLEKESTRRYPSALALAEDLELWLRHEPIQARRAGFITRSRKWVRRHAVVAAVTPLLVALFTAIGLMVWKNAPPETPPVGIAVLPFENLSEDRENSLLADGLQDDILTKLAKLADLKVISRTSVMGYRGERNIRKIGNALRVSHVLEGSVHRVDGRIRVNAQLIDARTDTHVWAQTYERDLTQVLMIESELTEEVARRLSVTLSASEKSALEAKPTQDFEAYELYSKARQLLQSTSQMDPEPEKNSVAAVDLLQKAVARDPNFALAWCALAEAAVTVYWTPDKPAEWLAKADAAVERATQLAPKAGETHLVRALVSYRKLDFDHALEELEIAARLLPSSEQVFQLSSWVERRMGRWHECLRHSARAVELDPRSAAKREDLIRDCALLRRYAEAARLADQAMDELPESADHFRIEKAGALTDLGDLPGARAALESVSPNSPVTVQWFLAWFDLLRYERNYAEAERHIATRSQLAQHEFLTPDVCFNGIVSRAANDVRKMSEAFTACREQLETNLRERSNEGLWRSMLGLANAALGRREEAVREVQRGWEMTDVLVRSLIPLDRANVYCALGDKDRALGELERAVKTDIGISYADLRFSADWDPLRDDLRFQKILEEAAKPLL